MARRLSPSKSKAKKRVAVPVETGPETIISSPRSEQVFELPVVEEVPRAARPTPDEAQGQETIWQPESLAAPREGLPRWRRRSASVFPWFAVAFLIAVVIQVYLAGANLFGALDSIDWHKQFVHVIEIIPVGMIAFAFLGGRKAAGWWSVGLLLAVVAQYGFAAIRTLDPPPSPALLAVAGLHVVNALFIFGVALLLVNRYPPWRRPDAA